MTKKNFILYKATVIKSIFNNPIYISKESLDYIKKMKEEGYKYIIKSKNKGYFELEFILSGEIFNDIKSKLIKELGDYYEALFDDFLDLYYHGEYHFKN